LIAYQSKEKSLYPQDNDECGKDRETFAMSESFEKTVKAAKEHQNGTNTAEKMYWFEK
jgi:hypothetical protein